MSMRTRMIMAILAAVIVPLVMVSAIVHSVALEYFEQYVGVHLHDKAHEAARLVDSVMYGGIKDINTVSTNPSFYLKDPEDIATFLSKVGERSQFYKKLIFVGLEGKVLAASDGQDLGRELRFSGNSAAPLAGPNKAASSRGMKIFSTVRDSFGNNAGTVVGVVSMSHLDWIVNEAYLRLADTGEKALMDYGGNITLEASKELRILAPHPDLHYEYIDRTGPSAEEQYFVFNNAQQQKMIAARVDLGEYGESQIGHWSITLAAPHDQLMQPIYEILQRVVWFSAFVLIAALLGAIWGSRMLVQPINALSAVVDRISKGEADLRADSSANHEIGMLAKRFNQLTDQLQTSKKKVERLLKRKSDFLACMSHEIRTPLNGIRCMSELLIESELSNEQKEQLTVAIESSDALLAMVDAILDFSRIEVGKFALHPRNFSLPAVTKQVHKAVEAQLDERQVELTQHIHSSVPEILVGDPGRLSHVLTALTTSLMKSRPADTAFALTVKVDSSTLDSVYCSFSIMDAEHDLGTSELEAANTLVKVFDQADVLNSVQSGGLGLNVSVAAALLQLMNSTLYVERVGGFESAFHFSVRFELCDAADVNADVYDQAQSEEAQTSTSPQASVPLKILVVEDNPVNQKVAYSLLTKLGHQVEVAADGQKALRILSDEENVFDLVLMDCQMPVMDGYQATELIRAKETEGKWHLPIVALTAYALDGDREKCLAAGMDGYLTKPLQKIELINTLAKYSKLP
ncbi:response regulator [Oligoflexia bacterium]|nr:response regulator [Oligoflexia bacterium]